MGDAEIQHPQAPLPLWRKRVGWRPPYRFKTPPCGDTWVCQVVIALWEITQATACTAKKRSRLITNRNVRS